MAVEAHHINLIPTQTLGNNREIMNNIAGTTYIYNTQMGYGVPLSGITTADTLQQLLTYNSVVVDSFSPKPPTLPAALKSDNTLNYQPAPIPRKRARSATISTTTNPFLSSYPSVQTQKNCSPLSFLGEDICLPIHQQQFDMDRLISQHMDMVRLEIEEKRKRQARRIMEAIEIGVMKKLKAKEEEIEKIGKMNWALEEKVKSLCLENQIWRDLAQNNEATANALRANLEQVLTAQVKDERGAGLEEASLALMDDAQSYCGSNCCNAEDEEDVNVKVEHAGWRSTLDGSVGNRRLVNDEITTNNNNNGNGPKGDRWGGTSSGSGGGRLCRNCGKEESCVLLLPCRHLCLCAFCGSSVHVCPVCKSSKKTIVHVNLS